MSRRHLLAVLAAGVGLAGCSAQHREVPPGRPVSPESPSTSAAALVDRWLDAYFAAAPGHARALGLHAYDGKVTPISAAEVARFLAAARTVLVDADAIDLAQVVEPTRLDLELVQLSAARAIFRIEVLRDPQRILSYGSLFDVSSYLVRDYAPLEQRIAALLDHVEAATREVPSLLALLDERQPRTHLETAKQIFAGMREYYETDVRREAGPALARDPALKARFEKVVPDGLAAVDRIRRWIDEVGMKHATDAFALGEANFLRMLAVNEGIQITLPELEKMASEDFERNHQAFVETAREIDPKLDVRAVAEKVASEHLAADKVLDTARRQLDQLLAYIQAHDIVSIGGEERAQVAVTPPFERWNSAFLDGAGPFEQAKGSYYYISPPDPTWTKAMQEAYLPYEGDLLSTSIHEVYPGHFVQGLHLRSAPTRAQKVLDSYAFVEGWAHYAEQMMVDAGYGAGDPRLKLGQLANALLRDCRFLAAIGLHTKGMTVKAAEKLFREKCFVDPGNAVQQAYRGTFDPGYLSYTLGKLQILDLRKTFFAKRGTQSLHVFHDWLLSFGAAPVPLIAKRL